MFENVADELVIWAYRNRWLKDFKKKEIYQYAVEILLLNAVLLLCSLLMSIVGHKMSCFVVFILFFIPLRMTLGGLHLKSAGCCMFCSLAGYLIMMCSNHFLYGQYRQYEIIVWLVCVVLTLLLRPLNNKNYNKMRGNAIVAVDALLIGAGIMLGFSWVSSAILFHICAMLLFIIAKVIEFGTEKNLF